MSQFEFLKQHIGNEYSYEEFDHQKENRKPMTQPMTRSASDRINVRSFDMKRY
jgi:hypothetical protein